MSETKHFDGTVEKITKDGERVMSSYLEEGEQLAADVDAEKSAENNRAAAQDRGAATEDKTVTSKSASGTTSKTTKG